MEALIKKILADPTLILAGLPLKWEEVPEDRRETVLTCALHCTLNGPVGVNKSTNFPLIDRKIKIKDLVNCSNKSWKGFCFAVATKVKELGFKLDCNAIRVTGEYWPLGTDWPQKIEHLLLTPSHCSTTEVQKNFAPDTAI